MMTVLSVLLFAAAAFFAGRMHLLDRRMQAFRAPEASRRAVMFVPVRWQQDLYVGEGRELVSKAWRAYGAAAACFFGGAILFMIKTVIEAAT